MMLDRMMHGSGDSTCADHALFDRMIHGSGDSTCADHALDLMPAKETAP
jgi:hypothetical protein